MGGCPVHIWVPLMAALLPFTRGIRDWLRARLGSKRQPPVYQAREIKRWAPVGAPATTNDEAQP